MLITSKQLATALHVSRTLIGQWTTSGHIPCHRFGHRTIRYRLDEVIAALEAGEAARREAQPRRTRHESPRATLTG